MRPPMQKSSLQQNEANRLQHQHIAATHKHLQQQQQQLQQQQQQLLQPLANNCSSSSTTTTAAPTNLLLTNKCSEDNLNDFGQLQQQQQQLHNTNNIITATSTVTTTTLTAATTIPPPPPRKSKLEQRELLVENHLNNACFAQPTGPSATATSSLPVFYNDFYHHQQQLQQRPLRPTTLLCSTNDNCSGVKLLDLISTSPPSQDESGGSLFRSTATIQQAVNNSCHQEQQQQQQQQQQHRYSYASQYSRSSSSDDSSSLSLNTACANQPVPNRPSRHNTFDDAAENFIINFPADTVVETKASNKREQTATQTPTAGATTTTTNHSSELYNYCLPLSETEPLLTNIEATVKDKQRSIYLNKNSASLIFTKKDLSATQPAASNNTSTTYHPPQQQQQQNFKLQSKSHNNNSKQYNFTNNRRPSAPTASSTFSSITQLQQQHSTLRSLSEETYRRKPPTKHLPATYHHQQQQQHRRSLQLNYNNNLVTTSTCALLANNNHHQQPHHCCGSSAVGGNSNSNSAVVLHKAHHNNHNYPQQQQHQAKVHSHQPQQQQQLQQKVSNSASSSAYNNSSSLANNTAAATRKQYAYSWYAPVYSALEEELEHDSRDSSPIHNLANTKKHHLHPYHQRANDLHSSSLTASATTAANASDTEREALLETRNNINIQAHIGGPVVNHLKRDAITKQLNPSKLALQHTKSASAKVGLTPSVKGSIVGLNGGGSGGDIASVEGFGGSNSSYDLEGPHAGSLGLAGGPQPRRIRFGNFLKSLVGLRPSVGQKSTAATASNGNGESAAGHNGAGGGDSSADGVQIPSSPEITITRTPSEQNMVVMRDPGARSQDYNVVYSSREKLANSHGERIVQTGGSTSSLNVMQQKLWNIVRREGSAISLHQEKSQSIVHYTGLRKCETVIALTRQASSPCSPTAAAMGMGGGGGGQSGNSQSQQRLPHTGSGIFSASGVEQIRPLNRLRNSVSSMNNTCSRCSSLLSLAASSSRYSLNSAAANPHPYHQHQHYLQAHPQQLPYSQQTGAAAATATTHFSQYQRNPSNVSSSNLSRNYSQQHSRNGSLDAVGGGAGGGLHFAVKRNNRNSTSSNNSSGVGSQRNSCSSSGGGGATTTSRTPSLTSPTTITTNTATTASTIKLSPPPTEPSLLTPPATASYLTLHSSPFFASSTNSREGAEERQEDMTFFPMEKTQLKMPNVKPEMRDASVIDGLPSSTTTISPQELGYSSTNVTSSTSANALLAVGEEAEASTTSHLIQPDIINATSSATSLALAIRPFELFTCKLCLIDVEDASNSTVLHQCGCQFCTECMKAYVEFEISEGAYEISCPDAQCPEQGVMTLTEIAKLTTTNLMKKHHRYRLNREIELDKTRTWCPRAGCETVCLIGSTLSSSTAQTSDVAAASTSSAASTNATNQSLSPNNGSGNPAANTPLLCAVQCPSCKDEFCSACKKTWHPNITCEEYSRRLAADGQDDIGIPFDNDLIKCCPMCAVPIEKDEGCAQMMCKRCKHVFCWYCLASLDDDFLLRHYDKGPCKNKLGHSRASVVWHRAQVIGIFAGFGILLLVASPLLLLAAPCIICCKCRSCSGSKMDEGDVDMDEATALQSLN
ncbi:pneumococcal serine-rich repeat protein [Musca domestica]|uniref:RBR-type E3 ubiquitin transferase n=2 Tax=Musca domestica TaxID=7370 RepID=A0ABM3VD85_MUSDO|nr:pneumococcal serine-rich repeat protein [Musca domestica]XP_058983760.1 pneumococcal serine-rich repeat protein [Musca domestica]XP_058983761.1 pneumococcal serine-rich repeat protein [Musca domestica]